MKSSQESPRMAVLGDKQGASPGAVMSDGEREYVVKLGIPRAHGNYKLNDYNDVDLLTAEMSRRSCDEKVFFNIAKAVGGDKCILPETDIIFMQPSNYSESSCSVRKKIASKCDVAAIESTSLDKMVIDEVVDRINSTELAHFRSEMIVPYKDVGKFYRYHVKNAEGEMRNAERIDYLPPEPNGMGAFFAINNFMGNYDCIGVSGGNVGFDEASNKLIIVDGGEMRITHLISSTMPSSANHQTWLSYEDLTDDGKKEAAEVFSNIASLDEQEIRALITNNEQFVDHNIFTEEEIEKKMGEFRNKQLNIVEVYYDHMVEVGCQITPKVEALKEVIDRRHAEEQRQSAIKMEKSAAALEREDNILGKRDEDHRAITLNPIAKKKRLTIDTGSEFTIVEAGKTLLRGGFTTPKDTTSPLDKENTPDDFLNRSGGKPKVR